MFPWRLIQTLLQDIFHGPVPGIIEVQCPSAGALQTHGTIFFREPDDPLGGPEIIQNPVAEKTPDKTVTRRTDRL